MVPGGLCICFSKLDFQVVVVTCRFRNLGMNSQMNLERSENFLAGVLKRFFSVGRFSCEEVSAERYIFPSESFGEVFFPTSLKFSLLF